MPDAIPFPSSLEVIVQIFDSLARSIATRHRITDVALLFLIDARVRRLRKRFVSLLARLGASAL